MTPLEPNHTHFVLVPAHNWGDESPWISQVATVLANNAPSLTVLLNGGEITFKDAFSSVNTGRLVVVIAGSGRTADILADALRKEATPFFLSRVFGCVKKLYTTQKLLAYCLLPLACRAKYVWLRHAARTKIKADSYKTQRCQANFSTFVFWHEVTSCPWVQSLQDQQ